MRISVSMHAMRAVEESLQDLGFAIRGWARTPAFAIAAIAAIAIGTGANTAVFTVVSGVLVRPLPFADPAALVEVFETQPRTTATMGFDGPVVFQDFNEWRSQSRLLQGIVTYSNSTRNFQAGAELEQVPTISAEHGFFGVLGIPALMGRTFGRDDPLNVAVASYGFWRTYLGRDPSAIGRTIELDGSLSL